MALQMQPHMEQYIEPSIHLFLLRYDTIKERSDWLIESMGYADEQVDPNLPYDILLEKMVEVCIENGTTDSEATHFFVDEYGFIEIPFCSDEYMEEYYSI